MNERDASTEMGWVAADAARANVTIHTFTAEMWALAASRSRPSMRSVEDRNLLMNNVEMLAGMTGGRSVRLTGQADTAFASLSAGLSGYYRLGVQALPEDLDGKDRRISVKLVAARRLAGVAIGGCMSGAGAKADDAGRSGDRAARRAQGRTAADRRRPARDVVRAARDHRTRGDLRVVVGRRRQPRRRRHGQGRGRALRLRRQAGDGDGEHRRRSPRTVPGALSIELTAPPGTYVLRVAVRDAEGRIGSLERLVDARWKKTGGIETPGLVLFRLRSRGARRAAPGLRRRHDRRRADRAGGAVRPDRRARRRRSSSRWRGRQRRRRSCAAPAASRRRPAARRWRRRRCRRRCCRPAATR